MNKTPHVEPAPPTILPYSSIGREFFMGSRIKNAEKVCVMLRDSLEIMDKLSERGWATTGQRVVKVMGLEAAQAWAEFFNDSPIGAHMRSSVEQAPPKPTPPTLVRWGKKPLGQPAETDLLILETEKAEDLYLCVNLLARRMRNLSRTVAGAAPEACTKEGYTWYPISFHVLIRAYDIPCSVYGNFVYANVANKENEFAKRRDILEQGKAIHTGLRDISQVSHLPSYFSSEQLPLYS